MTFFYKSLVILGIAEIAGAVAANHPFLCIGLGCAAGVFLGGLFVERSKVA